MNEPFAQAEQLWRTVQSGSGPALSLATSLLALAQNLPGPAAEVEGVRSYPSGAGAILCGPTDVRLCREEGPWQMFSVSMRGDGGCVVDVDGASYRVTPSGAILDEDAQDRHFEETVEKFEAASEQGVAPPVRAPNSMPEWTGLTASLLGLGTAAAALAEQVHEAPAALRFHPEAVILVPGYRDSVPVQVEVSPAQQGEVWELQAPGLANSAFQAIAGAAGPSGCSQTDYPIEAREKRSGRRLQTVVQAVTVEPGVVFFSALPLRLVVGEERELRVGLYVWNSARRQLEVDEQGLCCLDFVPDPPLAAAQVAFSFGELRGEGLGRHAVYRAQSGLALPGVGFYLANVRVGTDAAHRTLPVALQLNSADWQTSGDKEAEWQTLLDVVERFCKPAGRDIYELLSMGLALAYPRATADSLLRTRRWILKEAVLSWQRNAPDYLHHSDFHERLSALIQSKPWLP